MKKKPEFFEKDLVIPLPEFLIGKWVLAEFKGTHASYHVVHFGMMGLAFFNTEEEAQIYKKNFIDFDYIDIMQVISTDYPSFEIRIYQPDISPLKK